MAFLRSSSHNCPYPAGNGDNVGLYQALAVANPSIQSRTGDITRRWVQECTGFPHQRSKILANPLTSISPWFNWKPLTFFEVLVISVNSEPVSRRPFPKAWSFAFPWGTVPKKKYFNLFCKDGKKINNNLCYIVTRYCPKKIWPFLCSVCACLEICWGPWFSVAIGRSRVASSRPENSMNGSPCGKALETPTHLARPCVQFTAWFGAWLQECVCYMLSLLSLC